MRLAELERQIRRFKAYKLTEDIEARKQELREKEEVRSSAIFYIN